MDINRNDVISSALAGVIGTLAFGGFFVAIGNVGVIKGAMPALYGLDPSLAVGGVIHLIHGAILGIIYTVLVSGAGFEDYLTDIKKALAPGFGYGVLTTALPSLLMPVWLSTVGFPQAPPFPNFQLMGLIGHIIYGVVLALAYPLIRNRLE